MSKSIPKKTVKVMSKDLPFFRFYVSEWLNDDIAMEPYNVKGVFADVCAFYWFQDCSIAKAKLEQRFSHVKDELNALFNSEIIKEDDNGFIRIKFLEKQYDKLSEKRKKRVEAGRKGGLARASNAKAKPKQSLSYKDKDKDKDKDKEQSATTVANAPDVTDEETWQDAINLARHLKDSICEFDPTHKYNKNPPSLDGWVKEIDRAIRLDGRTTDQLQLVIDYIFTQSTKTADFWKPNIQSGKKLREHFDTIKQQAQRENSNGATDKLEEQLKAFE